MERHNFQKKNFTKAGLLKRDSIVLVMGTYSVVHSTIFMVPSGKISLREPTETVSRLTKRGCLSYNFWILYSDSRSRRADLTISSWSLNAAFFQILR